MNPFSYLHLYVPLVRLSQSLMHLAELEVRQRTRRGGQ